MSRSSLLIYLLIAGSFLVATASIINVLHVLHELGVDSILTDISLGGEAKIYISLYLTLSSISFGGLAFGIYFWWKGLTRQIVPATTLSGMFQLFSLLVAYMFGFSLPDIGIVATVLGATVSLVVAGLGLSVSLGLGVRKPRILTYEVAVMSVMSALTAVITIITGALIPSPTGGYTHIGDMIIFVAALLFGSKVGGITGMIGSVVADFWLAYPRWFVSIPAHGLEGIIAGFGKKKSILIQIMSCIIGGFIMASIYFYVNIFIKGYPLAIISYARDLFGQAGISMVLAISVSRSARKAKLPRL